MTNFVKKNDIKNFIMPKIKTKSGTKKREPSLDTEFASPIAKDRRLTNQLLSIVLRANQLPNP